jgi:hypothetical protein
MTGTLRRLRRVIHSLTDRSAPRILSFLAFDAVDKAFSVPADSREVTRLVPPMPTTFDKVPKIIFQTWKSRVDIPQNYRYWRDTFIANNPDWACVLWDDADNRAFITERFPWFLDQYNAYPAEIYRADIVRFFFLYEFGGLYADMDSECLRPLDFSGESGSVLLGRMGADADFEHSVPNAMMASQPRQLFWLFAIAEAMRAAERHGMPANRSLPGPEPMTGPILLKQAYDRFCGLDQAEAEGQARSVLDLLDADRRASTRFGSISLLDRRRWYPIDWTNTVHKALRNRLRENKRMLSPEEARSMFPDSEMVTYWSHSW